MSIPGALIKAGKPIAKEAVDQVFKSLPDFLPKLNKVGKELKFSPQTTDSVTRYLSEQTTENLPKRLNEVNTMIDAMVSKDGGIRNDGFRSFNEFESNIRPMYEKSSQADAMVKRADSYKGIPDNYPPGITEDFTVNPEFQSKSLVEVKPDQIDWKWDEVEKTWADLDVKTAEAKQAAELAGKEFKPKDDLVSLQATLGPIDPTDVKGWVKGAMAKFKSGLGREVGGTEIVKKGRQKVAVAEIEGMTYLELHHELMKKLYAGYMMKAKALYEAGQISRMDVLNFQHLAADRGFGMGDYGVKGYNRAAHSLGHQRAIQMAIQPTGDKLTEATEAISKIENINDLTSDFVKSMDTVAEPMRRELDLSQRAYNAMPVEDRKQVILLYRRKDKLKLDLTPMVRQDFENLGLKPPKKKNGEELLAILRKKGKEATPATLQQEAKVKEARAAAEEFMADIKARTSEQINKDIQLDIGKGIARDRPGKGVGRSGLYPEEARLEDESYRQFEQMDNNYGLDPTDEYTTD